MLKKQKKNHLLNPLRFYFWAFWNPGCYIHSPINRTLGRETLKRLVEQFWSTLENSRNRRFFLHGIQLGPFKVWKINIICSNRYNYSLLWSISIVELFSLWNIDLNRIIQIIYCLKVTDRFLKIRHSFASNGSIERQNIT